MNNIEEKNFKNELVKEMEKDFCSKVVVNRYKLSAKIATVLVVLAKQLGINDQFLEALKNKEDYEGFLIKLNSYTEDEVSFVLDKEINIVNYKDLYHSYISCLCFFKPTYPIGTVVKIKQTQKYDEEPLFIVTNRFLINPELKDYVEYELSPYPFGNYENSFEGKIYTSEYSFSEIIFKGYENFDEYCYAWNMKYALFIDDNYLPFDLKIKEETNVK